MLRTGIFCFSFCLASFFYLNTFSQEVLVELGSNWKYHDFGANLGSTWVGNGFNDQNWANGNAQLGYGEGDETTTVSYGSNSSDKHITTYFRKTFSVVNPARFDDLDLSLLRDDGAVVYLNGIELMRSNMPSGAINYQTTSSSIVSGADENVLLNSNHSANLLQAGQNVIAVEIHQRDGTSSDLSFDMRLVANEGVMIASGSQWRYLDNGSNQGSAWRGLSFNDANWSFGNAQLGYGDGDETTTVSYGSNPFDKHPTTYFRKYFQVNDATGISALYLRLLRDDGAVVYLNGTEVLRNNMNAGTVNHDDYANNTVSGSAEDVFNDFIIDATALLTGLNVLAVEIHQDRASSSDISFDLEMKLPPPPTVVRGPYIQMTTPGSTRIKWRTLTATESAVRYGTNPGNLTAMVSSANLTTDHELQIQGLNPSTRYYYSVGTPTDELEGNNTDFYFETAPLATAEPEINFWVLGDCGTGNNDARAVRDAYSNFMGGTQTDMIVLLGDNAYDDGTDLEYQYALFENMFEAQFRKSTVWSCPGNHDMRSASSGSQSGAYYDIFSFPRNGEAGGLASGTEAYYSYDYGNVHFISLDSHDSDRDVNGPMLSWLEADLAATDKEWIIAFWHHPPYTKGSHDSDNIFDSGGRMTEMRQNALPILENGGVDLVLSGHSHSFERSYLLNGHYGFSSQLSNLMILDGTSGRENVDCAYNKHASADGAVYTTAGSSGKISGGALNHPAMYASLNELGSIAVKVKENRLDFRFVNDNGAVTDYFTLLKNTRDLREVIQIDAGESVDLSASWPSGDYVWSHIGADGRTVSVSPNETTIYLVSDLVNCQVDTFEVEVTAGCFSPSNVAHLVLGLDEVRLSWQQQPLAIGYEIRGRFLGATQYITLNVNNGATTSRDVQLPDANRVYEWSVRAICAGEVQYSDYSQSDTIDLTAGNCPVPTQIRTTAITTNSARLNWAQVQDAVQYEISGNQLGRSGRVNLPVNGAATGRTVNGLAPNRSYFWQIRAVCPSGISAFSIIDTFTTLANTAKNDQVRSNEDWSILPNPSSGNFALNLNNFGNCLLDLTIHNSAGELVHQQSVNFAEHGQISLNLAIAGVYIVRLKGRDVDSSKQLVVSD